MTIRIISGSFGGRKLRTVPGRGTRPLLGQVREAVFNILGDACGEAEVWDLFAGTGVNGIEALSRGAARVTFVEKSNQALRILRENLETVDPEHRLRWEVVRADAWDPPLIEPREAEPGEGRLEVAPDLVFFDPPYAAVTEDPTLAVSRLEKLLARVADGGRVVFHFPEGVLDEDDLSTVGSRLDLRCWGTSAVALIRK